MMSSLARTTFRKHLLPALSFVGLSMAATDSLAYDTPILGGDGGGKLEANCPAGSALVGFNLRSGKDLDHITPLCAELRANATTGTPTPIEKASFGGNGGSVQKTFCPPNTVVTHMVVARSRVAMVNHIEVTCSDMVTGKPVKATAYPHGGESVAPDGTIGCNSGDVTKNGEVATGLIGRSGAMVDALGLRCATTASVQPALKNHVTGGKGPGPDPRPGPGPVTGPVTGTGCTGLAGDELAICNQHNADRAQHSAPALTWDPTLAKNAQAWVNGCHKAKDKDGNEFFCHQKKHQTDGDGLCGTDASYHYGENLSYGIPSRTGQEAIDGWYCEGDDYDYNNPKLIFGTMHGCGKVGNPNGVNGHFTQVVWKSTTKLGCAKNTCSLGGVSGTLWACEYDSPGNDPSVVGQNVLPVTKGFTHARRHTAAGTVQTTTAATSDVDLYDQPGGHGKKTGILKKGQQVALTSCRGDNWCQVAGGWVWGALIARSHSR